MLDTPWSEVVWRVLATHSIRQFPLHFPSRASPFTITFQLDSTAPILLLTSVLVERPDRLNPFERAASAHYTRELVNRSINSYPANVENMVISY